MKGLLKTKPAYNQLLILASVVLVSFFIIGLIGTILLSLCTGISLDEMKDLSKLDFSKPAVIPFLRGMQLVQFISLFIIPVFICAWLFSREPKKYLGLKPPSHNGYIITGVALMLIAIPFTYWLGELNRNVAFPQGIENWVKEQENNAEKAIRALLSKHTMKDLVLNIIFIAALAAVGEELLFRGLVQRLLIKWLKIAWAGIIISAALFSALHMQFYGFLPRFILGILLGAMYWYSGSLWVAILAHFIYDAVLIVVVYFNAGLMDEKNNVSMPGIEFVVALSFLLTILLILWMKRRSTTTYNAVYAGDAVPVKNHPFDFDHNTPE